MATSFGIEADEAFVELICADEDLLHAEFDAIVAAGWPEQRPVPPAHGWAVGRRPGPPRSAWCATRPARRPGTPSWARDAGTRQRAPPTHD